MRLCVKQLGSYMCVHIFLWHRWGGLSIRRYESIVFRREWYVKLGWVSVLVDWG